MIVITSLNVVSLFGVDALSFISNNGALGVVVGMIAH